MATVYLARDRELGREVALKVMRLPEPAAGIAERLRQEARILAQLEHPGLVPVHDVGTLPDGRVFYAMKRVRGRRLDEHLRDSRSLPERLRLFERICLTVAFAHAQGVIHRDLKPANVMVGPFGEVLVLDWGVAKLRDEGLGPAPLSTGPTGPATAHGAVVGTPGYMPPEQARGLPVDARADVFALGRILESMLTGHGRGGRGRPRAGASPDLLHPRARPWTRSRTGATLAPASWRTTSGGTFRASASWLIARALSRSWAGSRRSTRPPSA